MDARLQRRVQRYGWDLAAPDYEALWQAQLAVAHSELLSCAAPAPGERVLDVACGTGLVTLGAARAVGVRGRIMGVDLSERMIDAAGQRARAQGMSQVDFARMDAEQLALPDGSFDVALCAFGLMFMPDPARAVRELRRVLRPGGRLGIAVWGERVRCGWSALFPIVGAEVSSEVCPMFFQLGGQGALAQLCLDAGFAAVNERRIGATLDYAHEEEACGAAFLGGPVALAWSRFSAEVRERVRRRYLRTIESWRAHNGARGYRIPSEFVIVSARVREAR